MSVNFPISLDTTTQLPTESANTPLSTNHVNAHTNLALAVIALETKLGVDSSAVNTTHDYKLSGVTTGDKAVSKTGTETLTNKTLTSPSITTPTITTPTFTLGSDATGDIWYRHSDGTMKRLAIGSTDYVLSITGGVPVWRAETSQSDASYSTKGIVKFLTDAATSGITVASGVANVNFGTGANQIVKLDSSAKLPAVDGSALTNIPTSSSTNGTTTKDISDASTTQTIAHSLGKSPKKVRLTFMKSSSTVSPFGIATLVYNGTTSSTIGYQNSNAAARDMNSSGNIKLYDATTESAFQVGVVTFDSTNISIAWTKTNSPTGTFAIMWEAQ